MSARKQKVLVVDDEPPARMRLASMVEDLPGFTVVALAENGEEALRQAKKLQPDIVLMDIRMPGKDGLQAAAELASNANPPAVIFCTAYDEHALAAFKASAVEYLLKPIKSDHLLEALVKAQRVNRAQLSSLDEGRAPDNQTLLVKTRGAEELIEIGEIRAMIADQKYVSAYLPGKELLIDGSLKSLETKYVDRFLRVHRNALVSIQHIEALETEADQHYLRLKGVDIRPVVSRRLLPLVRRTIRGE